MRLWRMAAFVVAFGAVVLIAAVTGLGQARPASADSPAALALASADSAPNLTDLLRQALASDQPDMRWTAARIAFVGNLSILAPDIARALGTEPVPRTAAAELRALLAFGGAEALGAVEAYAKRTTGRDHEVYARALAQSSPEQFAARLDDMLARSPAASHTEFQYSFREAVRRRPDLKAALSATWMSRAPDTWSALVDLIRPENDAELILAAMTSEHDAVRSVMVWHLLKFRAWGTTLPAHVVAAAMPNASSPPTNTPTWEQIGRELMARTQGQTSTPDRSVALGMAAPAHRTDIADVWWLEAALTTSERTAVWQALGENFPGPKPRFAPPPYRPLTSGPQVMRTMPAPLPGLIPAILQPARCETTAAQSYAAIRLTYRPDGRPLSASIDGSASRECQRALRALIQLAVEEETLPRPGSNGEWLVLFLGRDYRQCVDAVPPEADVVSSDNEPRLSPDYGPAAITRPKKTRDVSPIYPASAKKERLQGMVVAEAVITRNGCVRDVNIVRSVATSLDFAALLAVTQWRYTPTLLQGKPVEVIMSVNVTFAIQ